MTPQQPFHGKHLHQVTQCDPRLSQREVKLWQFISCVRDMGSKGLRSGRSTRLPSVWPGLKSWCRHHMWVEFVVAGLCSSRALWPLVPNFCSWTTRKSQIFHTNHILGTLVFTGSEHWAPFHFPQSTALCWFSPFLWDVFIAVFPSPQKTYIFKFQFDQQW